MMTENESSSNQLKMIADGWMQNTSPTFEELSASILQTHHSAHTSAIKAINQMATLRNWLIGCYIVEYEQKGCDRAKYGDRLLKRLEESVNTKGLNLTLFKNSRRFYLLYPQIGQLFGKSPTSSDLLETEEVRHGKSPMASDFLGADTSYAIPSQKFMTTPKCHAQRVTYWGSRS